MKKSRMMVITLAVMAMLSGCAEKATSNHITETVTAQNKTETVEQPEIELENTIPVENMRYTWQDINVTFPESWKDKYLVQEKENGFSVFQKKSYEKEEGMGCLFGFIQESDWINAGMGERLLAYTDEGVLYYVIQPTDVTYYEEEDIRDEYAKMQKEIDEVIASLKITNQLVPMEAIHYDADEYIIPISNILQLKEDYLFHMTDNELWMARNEIFARHGRGFQNEYLQGYFNSCSWYTKTTEPEAFDEAVLSPLEKDNLELIKAAENNYAAAHPYPKEYSTDQTVSVDVSGDGTPNEIRYQVKEESDGAYTVTLTIDGTDYNINDYEYIIYPTEDVFYITDIAEHEDGLEIALLDEGPSSDPVTNFYHYDGNLRYIGSVGGFPFKEQDRGRNGFSGQNGITGLVRMDLIETTYLDGYWWYNSNEENIEYMEIGMHQYQNFPAHELFVDLPVYLSMDETSSVTTMPAQKEVYFIQSDMQEWIYVRAKDGTKGYIRVKDGEVMNVNQPADTVFSDLYYFD